MPQDRTGANDGAGLADGHGGGVALRAKRPLGDFTTDRRVLILVAMSLVVGTGGALDRLSRLTREAVAAIPACPGAAALTAEIEAQARLFLPASLRAVVA